MKYQLAQLNIAKFKLPVASPENDDFVNNLDAVNASAEAQPGFVWRFTGAGNDALDVQAFEDPNMVVNLSVWQDIQSLVNFVYRNEAHKDIMRRRKEWFDKLDFYMVLWWLEEGELPTVEEAKIRLELLKRNGPTYSAFSFKKPYSPPASQLINPFNDECA